MDAKSIESLKFVIDTLNNINDVLSKDITEIRIYTKESINSKYFHDPILLEEIRNSLEDYKARLETELKVVIKDE